MYVGLVVRVRLVSDRVLASRVSGIEIVASRGVDLADGIRARTVAIKRRVNR